jgi:hypothetical protein
MTLGNMREQGVHHLIAFCHNDACRHQALIDVSSYAVDTSVPLTGARYRTFTFGSKLMSNVRGRQFPGTFREVFATGRNACGDYHWFCNGRPCRG